VAWTTLAFARVVKPAFGEVRERFSSLNSRVQQNIAGSRVVRAFRGEARERELFETENRAFGEANLAATAAWARFLPALELISGALGLVAIVGGGWMVIAGKLTMGDLIVFNGMVWMFNNPMRMAPGIVNNIEQFRASLEKVHRIVAEEPRVAESPGARDPGPFRDSLEFHGVSFSYGDGLALDGVDFRLPRGGKLGIVGPTGSGKSTIASLILREYDPSSGAVLADGRDLRELPLASLHRLAGCAMQEVFLFSDSVAANIAFARPAASRAEIERAARLAEAEEFILGLEEGYDTVIGERGVGLSGGQRQRLALARLLLADPDILVLDDTTSAVDIGTERRINAALARLRGEKTIVVVGHRLSSVRDAGLILVMDRGRVAEQGNHAELVAAGGWYSRVWERQRGSVAAAMEGSVDGP
jgi:ATP-binding cassette subfamily B protein